MLTTGDCFGAMVGNLMKKTKMFLIIAASIMSCQVSYNYRDMPAQEIKETIISVKEIEELVDRQSRFETGPRDDLLYFWDVTPANSISFFLRRGDIYILDYTFDRIKVFDFKKKAELIRVIKLPQVYQYMYPYKKDKIILLSRFEHCAIIEFNGSVLALFEYKFPNMWTKYYFRNDIFYRFVEHYEVYADRITLSDGKVKINVVWSEKYPDPEEYYQVWPTENYHRYVKALEQKTSFLFRTNKYIFSENITDRKIDKKFHQYIIGSSGYRVE